MNDLGKIILGVLAVGVVGKVLSDSSRSSIPKNESKDEKQTYASDKEDIFLKQLAWQYHLKNTPPKRYNRS